MPVCWISTPKTGHLPDICRNEQKKKLFFFFFFLKKKNCHGHMERCFNKLAKTVMNKKTGQGRTRRNKSSIWSHRYIYYCSSAARALKLWTKFHLVFSSDLSSVDARGRSSQGALRQTPRRRAPAPCCSLAALGQPCLERSYDPMEI